MLDVYSVDFKNLLNQYIPNSLSKSNVQILATIVRSIQATMDFKVTNRGWAYILEGAPYRVITKKDFDPLSDALGKARYEGFLPLDFTAEDSTRRFSNLEKPTTDTIDEHILRWFNAFDECEEFYNLSFWEGQKYYVEMLVEKIDLKELNITICKKYHIPIATSRGWSDIPQKMHIVERFAKAKENGQIPVLLIEGDLDDTGLQISSKIADKMVLIANVLGLNLRSCDFVVDRFGLNKDFIEANNLSWIKNLTTSGGMIAEQVGDNPYEYVQGQKKNGTLHPYFHHKNVQQYLREVGARKCEANSLVIAPKAGRKLCKDAIEKYISDDAIENFEWKEAHKYNEIKDRIKELGIDGKKIREELNSENKG